MKFLSIESSCDETGIAILEVEGQEFKVFGNVLNSQIEIHKKTSGVVPEVAARRHVEVINELLSEALNGANLKMDDIDFIAVTYGPGLIGSLIVGVEMAKTLAYLYNKPIIPVNHLQAHIDTNYFNEEDNKIEELEYQALALLVSGGHTELILIESDGKEKVIGQTLDDAVGESFDKVARLLELPYPGGPEIAKLALFGDRNSFELPLPLKNTKDFNFSYSGLKTAVRDIVKSKDEWNEKDKANLCASFESMAIKHLLDKTVKAVEKYNIKTLLVAGGVSANKYLREELKKQIPNEVKIKIPNFHLCTDNALMVAMSGYMQYKKYSNALVGWDEIQVDPSLNI